MTTAPTNQQSVAAEACFAPAQRGWCRRLNVRSSLPRMTWCLLLMGGLLPMVTSEAGAENTKEAVAALLNAQADAWNHGDLDKFMTGYVKSGELSFYSSGGELHGYEALKKRYETRYGTNRDSMGKLQFFDLNVTELGAKHAMCLGHWHLERTGQASLAGLFTLILQRSDDGWRILHDHTSVLDNK